MHPLGLADLLDLLHPLGLSDKLDLLHPLGLADLLDLLHPLGLADLLDLLDPLDLLLSLLILCGSGEARPGSYFVRLQALHRRRQAR